MVQGLASGSVGSWHEVPRTSLAPSSALLRSAQSRHPPDVLRSPLRFGRRRTDVPRTSCNPSSARLRLLWGRCPWLKVSALHSIFRVKMGEAKLYGFRSKLHIRSEGEDKLMSQKKYSLLYPDTNAQYRTLSDVTMHDLGMDQICKKLSAKEREQNYIQNVMARLYADPAVTQYRCDIFEDVLQQKKMRDDLMEILERISFLREYGSFNREYDESACIWDLLHRLDELNDYIKCVDALHTCLAASDIHSAGFLGLKAYVEKIYADNGFAELKKDISELHYGRY